GRRAQGAEPARRHPGRPALPGSPRMLNRRWRARLALAAVAGLVSMAALPAGAARAATADGISDKQPWVVSRGAGVTVAVIDSGVNPDVSDLTGSVITGPDYTGVSTSPDNRDWGV